MNAVMLPVMGIISMLVGLYLMACAILVLTINKDSRLYKYLTKPNLNNWLEKYMHEHLSEKANRIIQIVNSIIFGTVMIVFGLNALVKGIVDPYGLGFWVIF